MCPEAGRAGGFCALYRGPRGRERPQPGCRRRCYRGDPMPAVRRRSADAGRETSDPPATLRGVSSRHERRPLPERATRRTPLGDRVGRRAPLRVLAIAVATAALVAIFGGGQAVWLCVPGALLAGATCRSIRGGAIGAGVVVAAAAGAALARAGTASAALDRADRARAGCERGGPAQHPQSPRGGARRAPRLRAERSTDRRGQPPLAARANRLRNRAPRAQPAELRAADARPRRLQAPQRPVRPPGRRRSAPRRGSSARRSDPRPGHARPRGRGRVLCAGAGDGRRREPSDSPLASRRPSRGSRPDSTRWGRASARPCSRTTARRRLR